MSSRTLIVRVFVFLSWILLALPLWAQEARWTELNRRVETLSSQGKYAEALPLARNALEVAERLFGPEDVRTAVSAMSLANAERELGKDADAESLYKRSLAIREKALGPDHQDVAESLNDLAELYQGERKFAEAEPLYKRSLAIYEKTLGPDHAYMVVSLVGLAVLYYSQGKYAEAEPFYKRSLAIYEEALKPDDPGLVLILNNLAELYRREGRYSDAEPLFKRSLTIRETALGPDHQDVAESLNSLALVYRGEGKYADAEPLFKRSLTIRENSLGPDHPDVATSLNDLAELYKEEGRYAEAEPLLKRSLAINEKVLGPEHPNVAKNLNDLAELYVDQGQYAEAEPLLKRSLAINEKVLGPQHPNVATNLSNIAELYVDEGKYAEAEPLHKESLTIREKTLGPDHPDVATSLHDLAKLYKEEGRYAEAEPLLKRSLAIYEKVLGPDHPDVATSLNDLAELYEEEGRFAEAEPLHKQSLTICEKALGPDHPDVAVSLNNLAELYSREGKYAEAELLYKRSLAISEKALGPDHIRVALSLNNLAELYVNEGKYAEAEPLLKRSLTTHEKVLGPDNVHVAPILNNLAKVYWIEAKYSDAEPLLKRSLAIYEEVLGPDHPDVALSLHNLALLYTNEGKYVEAEPLYKRSLAISEKVLGPDHPDVATALSNLAELYWGEGEYVQAEPLFERSLENLSRQFDYSFTYMSERDRLQFLPIVRDNFEAYLSFCLAHVHDDSALAAKMYDLLLWEKGIVGSSLAALRARVAANGDREALKLFEEVASKRSESSHLATTRPAGWQDLKKKIDDEANELEGQLVRLVSSVREEKDIAHASWRDVQAKLQPGEAAIEFVRFHYYDGKKWTGDSEYVALVVTTQTRSAPTLVPLGLAKDLEGDPLRDYRIRLGLHEYETTRGVNVIEQRESESGAPKSSFYDAYWKPLESSLGGVTRIYLSPDGALNQVALGDITVPDGQLLMEKYDLRIVSSTKDILRTAQKHSSDVAVLVGNPMFDLDEAHERTALQALRTNQGTQSAHATGDDDAGSPIPASDRSRDLVGGKLDPLKATQKEVQEISAVLEKKHWRVETYTGENALKEAVTRVQSPRVLHLATHGFFESDQKQKLQRTPANQPSGLEDPMLRSGLFFAGANRVLSGESIPTDLDDGVLTAYEASSLNLQGTELVVLSACETGLGEVEAGEGVFGLRRAFQVAGAESILMSMWSVPDKETQELMGLFYKKWLAGEEKHEALREAQLEMRTRVEHRYGKDSPRYWGAFVLVGR